MEASMFGELIKTGKGEIKSCTLTNINRQEKAVSFHYINFRKAVEKKCGILFYSYKDSLYYPLSMEFRLIDNNILHLICELDIKNFSDLALLLQSSFNREESLEVDFFAVIYKMKNEPKYCTKLDDFVIDTNNVEIIHEQ